LSAKNVFKHTAKFLRMIYLNDW